MDWRPGEAGLDSVEARHPERRLLDRLRHPIVDRVFPLAEAQAAQDLVEASTHFGKVVLVVREDLD